MIVVAIGKPPAWPSAIASGMLGIARITPSRKTAPMAPEIQIDDEHAARRLAARIDGLLAEGARRCRSRRR